MVIKQNVAFGIVGGISQFWKCNEFQDFTVIAGDVQFECHRFLLAACSDYFRGLFRSGMQETEQKSVTIKDVSTETFELIMESIYTGRDVLTNDNVTEIWEAAHQLQIHFLVSECELYVLEHLSLENYVQYLQTSTALNSDVVLKRMRRFVLKNFHSFFQRDYFLELRMADVLSLIKSQALVTKSEDDVIHAIFKWVEFSPYADGQSQSQFLFAGEGVKSISNRTDQNEENESGSGEEVSRKSRSYKDNDVSNFSTERNDLEKADTCDRQGDLTTKEDREKLLLILLSHVRMCLASQECLEMLVNHTLAKNNKNIKDIAIDALLYKLQIRKRNGQWPSGAVHRNNSDFINCLVKACKIGDRASISAYSLASEKWLKLPGLVNVGSVNLAAVDHELYLMVTGISDSKLVYFQLGKGRLLKWNLSLNLSLADISVTVVDSFIYIFSPNDQTVWRLNPTSQKVVKISDLTEHEAISYLTSYDQWILVFYNSTVKDVVETVVQCYDTSLKIWTKLNNLKGPAEGMTSFKDDHFTYLLQPNGKLWKVVKTQANHFDFEFVVNLWACNWPLYGAVTFMSKLHIHGAKSDVLRDDPHLQRSLPGVFSDIIYMESSLNEPSMAIPFIMDRQKLLQI